MILRRLPRFSFRSLQHSWLLTSGSQNEIMTSYFSKFSPVPAFPSYTGPHKVGTIDVEIPVSELDSPSATPDDSITTVQFRIFYPCAPDSQSKNISWIPKPQREYVSAYARFLGAGNTLADFISYFPRILHYISIPAFKNASLAAPETSNSRWPVMIFSHGLGGSRNAYSHLVGSIASHGVIVIAPEHRDGSGPISYIRTSPSTSEKAPQNSKTKIDYVKLSHTPSPEVEDGRNAQLKIRLWEIGLIHDALLKLDNGEKLTNLNTSSTSLAPFKDQMAVHEPGSITFAGHSFGAATTAQLVKSTFYSNDTSAPSSYTPIFKPTSTSSLVAQITPHTPVILLDVWCLPLRAASTRWLWNKPMPCYAPGGPGGKALLAVESQAFYKWSVHLKATKRLLSPDPESDVYDYNSVPEPHFYYPTSSAHLSQSDFGILFPWLTKKAFAAEEPERVMRLNVRAVLQVMREVGIEVGKTSREDMEMEGDDPATEFDEKIFGGKVRGWNFITTDVGRDIGEGEEKDLQKEPADAVVGGELMKDREGTGEKL